MNINTGKLKLKLSTGEIELEIEGDAQTVIQQFEKILDKGLGTLTPQFPRPHQIQSHSHEKEDFDSLRNVVAKGLPGSEMEWILVYSFYASKFGIEKFDRNDLLKKYVDTERLEKSRKSNLSNNIITAIRRNWITKLTERHFRMTDEGLKRAKEILERKSSPKPVRPFKKRDKKQDENKNPLS